MRLGGRLAGAIEVLADIGPGPGKRIQVNNDRELIQYYIPSIIMENRVNGMSCTMAHCIAIDWLH